MTVLLAALAAVIYGTSDFVGGLASRQQRALTVLVYTYPTGAVLMAALLALFPGTIDGRTIAFGVLGGLAGMLGVSLLYRLLATSPMNVVSPVSAVFAALFPVVFGVVTGDRPSLGAWAGIALGPVAVVLVSRSPVTEVHARVGPRTLALACLAGIGFGGYFICLARAPHDSGLWPLLVSRITSALILPTVALARGAMAALPARVFALAVSAGALDALANLFFLLASRHGLLSLASVITALYPAATVLLAVGVLRERTNGIQRVGLALAAVSIVLVTR